MVAVWRMGCRARKKSPRKPRERENRAVEFGKKGGFETFLREKGGKIG